MTIINYISKFVSSTFSKQTEIGNLSLAEQVIKVNNNLHESAKSFGATALAHLNKNLTFPEYIPTKKLCCGVTQNEKNTIYTLKWSIKSEQTETMENERIVTGKKVSEQFTNDWHRSEYYFTTPGNKTQKLNSEGSESSDFIKDSRVIDFIEKEKAKFLTEVAHQGHQAVFLEQTQLMQKEVTSGEMLIPTATKNPPRYDIEHHLDNTITLKSTSSFNIKSTDTNNTIEGITITLSRKNRFEIKTVKDNPDINTGYLHEQNDGLNIEITYSEQIIADKNE